MFSVALAALYFLLFSHVLQIDRFSFSLFPSKIIIIIIVVIILISIHTYLRCGFHGPSG
jgi:hypothetical protein